MKSGRRKFGERVIWAPTTITRYQLRYTAFFALVPIISSLLLFLLLYVFSSLNLYFLEAHGLILNEDVRAAYYNQMQMEVWSVAGYLGLQVLATALVAYFVMQWSTAPFLDAQRSVEAAIDNTGRIKPSRWFSESPTFDRLVWLFCLRIKSGGENPVNETIPPFGANLPFLAKFLLAFGALAFCNGYVTAIVLDSVYGRVVDLALHLLRQTSGSANHYFLAQQAMLRDANVAAGGFAMALYFLLGLQVSRYMGSMLFVFSRALHEDRFPITLRSSDLYQPLADRMNEARAKIPNKA